MEFQQNNPFLYAGYGIIQGGVEKLWQNNEPPTRSRNDNIFFCREEVFSLYKFLILQCLKQKSFMTALIQLHVLALMKHQLYKKKKKKRSIGDGDLESF